MGLRPHGPRAARNEHKGVPSHPLQEPHVSPSLQQVAPHPLPPSEAQQPPGQWHLGTGVHPAAGHTLRPHDSTFQGDREVDVERVGLVVAEIRQGLGVL